MSNEEEDKTKRRFTFHNVVRQAMKMESMKRLAEPVLEPLLRKVVKEEVDIALRKYLRNEEERGSPSHSRSLKLKFCGSFLFPIFTGGRIEAEDTIKIALIDSETNEFVGSGPESSARVEVVVLEGDFDEDDWTREDFESNVVREREGRKPLLYGERVQSLNQGFASLNEVSFTDNSSWTRSRKFRLGARALEQFNFTRIQEAKTEPFVVRDHRGESYKKHHPPSLCDEVWRLEKIGKDGAFHKRLQRENIATVEDFLKLLEADSARLRHILGMSSKMWEATEQHARTCAVGKRVYLYESVAFNAVGQVLGLVGGERGYIPVGELSDSQKEGARRFVNDAFARWDDVVSFEDEASLSCYERDEPYDLMSSNKRIRSELNVADCDSAFIGMEDLDLIYDNSFAAGLGEDHLSYFEEGVMNVEAPSGSFVMSHSVSKSLAKRRWKKVSNVMKWFYVRRIVALKRAEQSSY